MEMLMLHCVMRRDVISWLKISKLKHRLGRAGVAETLMLALLTCVIEGLWIDKFGLVLSQALVVMEWTKRTASNAHKFIM